MTDLNRVEDSRIKVFFLALPAIYVLASAKHFRNVCGHLCGVSISKVRKVYSIISNGYWAFRTFRTFSDIGQGFANVMVRARAHTTVFSFIVL
jgi:hypothetical protein